MIRTSGFRQLVRSPFVTFKSAFVNLPRLQIPCRASSLCRFGLDAESAEAIKDLSDTPSEEARLVAAFILIVYHDELLESRRDLLAWINRKGGIDADKKAALTYLAHRFEAADALWLLSDTESGNEPPSDRLGSESALHQRAIASQSPVKPRRTLPITRHPKRSENNFFCLACA